MRALNIIEWVVVIKDMYAQLYLPGNGLQKHVQETVLLKQLTIVISLHSLDLQTSNRLCWRSKRK